MKKSRKPILHISTLPQVTKISPEGENKADDSITTSGIICTYPQGK